MSDQAPLTHYCVFPKLARDVVPFFLWIGHSQIEPKFNVFHQIILSHAISHTFLSASNPFPLSSSLLSYTQCLLTHTHTHTCTRPSLSLFFFLCLFHCLPFPLCFLLILPEFYSVDYPLLRLLEVMLAYVECCCP